MQWNTKLKWCNSRSRDTVTDPLFPQHGWFILIAVTKLILFYSLRAVRKLLPLVIQTDGNPAM